MPFLRRRKPEPDPPPEAPRPAPDLPTSWTGWDHVPPERRTLAAEIEASEDFGVDADAPGRYRVNLYDDVRGMVGDDAIEALADKLRRLDGVDACVHSDREVLDVEGAITAAQLAAFVVAELAATGDPHFWDD